MRNRKFLQDTALVISVLFFLSMAVSFTFLIVESNHDCSGEDCPVCAELEACEALLKTASTAGALVIRCIFSFIFVLSLFYHYQTASLYATPVSLKVKLLN